jgi:hypothetical protein
MRISPKAGSSKRAANVKSNVTPANRWQRWGEVQIAGFAQSAWHRFRGADHLGEFKPGRDRLSPQHRNSDPVLGHKRKFASL